MNLIAERALLNVTPQELLQRVVEVGRKVMQASNVVAALVDHVGDEIRVLGDLCTDGDFLHGKPVRPASGDTAIHRMVRHSQPFFVERVDIRDAITVLGGGMARIGSSELSFIEREELHSVAALPVMAPSDETGQQTLVGVIFFNFRQPQSFADDNDRATFETFAHLAGLAIDAARRTRYSQTTNIQARWMTMHDLYFNRMLLIDAAFNTLRSGGLTLEALNTLESELAILKGYLRFETEGLKAKLDERSVRERLANMVRVLCSGFSQTEFYFDELAPWPALPTWAEERLEAFAREGVVNALKHAKPKHIWITWGQVEDIAYLVRVQEMASATSARAT